MTIYSHHNAKAFIIGSHRPAREALPSGRRAPTTIARDNARTPVPRRIPNDFYPTPPEATRALLSVEQFDGPIWEPACGEGAVAKVLELAGHRVVSTDLVPYGFGVPEIDFLKQPTPQATHIVTNPPYGNGLADAFLTQALSMTRITGGKVALLLNLASLCHPCRTRLWRSAPPARLYAMDGIVCWPEHRYGPAPQALKRHRYVWAIWSPDHSGPTTFGWLSAGDFR